MANSPRMAVDTTHDRLIRRFRLLSPIVCIFTFLVFVLSQWERDIMGDLLTTMCVAFCIYAMFIGIQVSFVRYVATLELARSVASLEKLKFTIEASYFFFCFGLLIAYCLAEDISARALFGTAAACLIPIGDAWKCREFRIISSDLRENLLDDNMLY